MSWIEELKTPGVTFSVTEYTADSILSYNEMLVLFQAISLDGITSNEFSDLKSIYTNGTDLFCKQLRKNDLLQRDLWPFFQPGMDGWSNIRRTN